MSEPNDKILDAYLAGESPLSRAYRASIEPAERPSAQSDAAIHAAARRELGARPTLVRAARWRTWYVPLSAAAMLVLASLLVLRVSQTPEGALPQPTVAQAPASAPTQMSAPAEEAPAAPPPHAENGASTNAVAPRQAAADKPQAKASRDNAVAVAEAVPPPARRAAPAEQKIASTPSPPSAQAPRARPESARARTQSAGTPAAAEVHAAPGHADAPAQPVLADQASEAPRSAPSGAGSASSKTTDAESVVGAMQAPPDDEAHAQERASLAKDKKRELVSDVPYDTAASVPVIPAPGSAARDAQAPAQQARNEDAQSVDLYANPERWLAHISRLHREGHLAQTREALHLFKQRYPQHALPRELELVWQEMRGGVPAGTAPK